MPAVRSIITFYFFAFLISWLGFLPLLYGASQWWQICLILPGYGPAAAVTITYWLFYRQRYSPPFALYAAFKARVHLHWYILALLIPPALFVATRLWRFTGPYDMPPSTTSEILSTTAMSVFANPWEEIAWRGFAQTRLQKCLGIFGAALVVGVLWGLWHTPLFLWHGSPMYKLPHVSWFLDIVSESCILAWLYNRASHNLVIASLFHISFNVSAAIIGVSSYRTLAVVNTVVAAFLFICLRPRELGEDYT